MAILGPDHPDTGPVASSGASDVDGADSGGGWVVRLVSSRAAQSRSLSSRAAWFRGIFAGRGPVAPRAKKNRRPSDLGFTCGRNRIGTCDLCRVNALKTDAPEPGDHHGRWRERRS